MAASSPLGLLALSYSGVFSASDVLKEGNGGEYILLMYSFCLPDTFLKEC